MIPFETCGGSGMGKTLDGLKTVCPNADWKEGKVVNGMDKKALAEWANAF